MKYSLVVDNSRVIRKIACRILESLKFQADEAEDTQSALDACRARMPDVILLDGNMPDMGGTEFLRALRRETDGEFPIVVYCTTENDRRSIAEALGAGASEVVMKPFDAGIIRSKLAEFGLL